MPKVVQLLKNILNSLLGWLWKTISTSIFYVYYLVKKFIIPNLINNKKYKDCILPGLIIILILVVLIETIFIFQDNINHPPIVLARMNQSQEKLVVEKEINQSVNNQISDFTIASTKNNNDDEPVVTLGGTALITPDILTDEPTTMRTNTETYVVQSGDTLESIAQKFNISIKSILWENKLTARSIIRPGQELSILPVDGITHKVKNGETLDKIAKTYKADVEDIIDFNNLADATDIHAGDLLIVPEGQLPPPPAPRKPVTPKTSDKTTLAEKTTQLPSPEGQNCHVFVPGQCTWYVAKKRCVPWTGHAKSWIANARRMGFTIGNTPAVGAILALKESWYGHVVYVESFDENTVTFSEMNHFGPWIKNMRTLNLNDKRIIGYIY